VPDDDLARRDDADSFAALYRRHLPAVFRYVSGRTAARDEVEDLTSEVFRRAWIGRRSYRGHGSFRAWIFAIVHRTLADQRRRDHSSAAWTPQAAELIRDGNALPEDHVIDDERTKHVQRLLRELGPQQQEVLRLRFAAELTYAEIARVLGKREDAVKKIAHWKRYEGEPPMSELNDLELDKRLADLERDMGPALPTLFAGSATPPEPRGELPLQLAVGSSPRPRGLLWIVGGRAWTALAAMLVVGLGLSAMLLASRPQPMSADTLNQLEIEAGGTSASGGTSGQIMATTPGGACVPAGAASDKTGVVLAIQTVPQVEPATSGPSTMADPNALSNQLAAALGVSGDQVRAAMLATMHADMPTPPDPMAGIAQQLGVSVDQVCSAFGAGQGPIGFYVRQAPPPAGDPTPAVPSGANVINLNTVTADQLTPQAQKLGVSPQQLFAAIKASLPSTPPPPPNPDQIIQSFAQNLGMPVDKVRAAITQVEGNKGFYFVVPVPGLGH
jgi:RNA polymerase sigma-70 factor (ECF subfamily)